MKDFKMQVQAKISNTEKLRLKSTYLEIIYISLLNNFCERNKKL